MNAPSIGLSGRQWLWVGLVTASILTSAPILWSRLEPFVPHTDYRLPYRLSDDYWLYQRRLALDRPEQPIYLVGDSVIWGEYVLPDGTLSHFLNLDAGSSNRFVNAGVNGLFPLALEGLIGQYGRPVRQSKTLLHVNLLWMSSPQADLSTDKETPFNHVSLVPQFSPRIPCYKAGLNARLTAIVRREVPFFAWVDHLQDAYFDQQDLLMWTLVMPDAHRHSNAYRNPFAQITLRIPEEPDPDPDRGPASARHRPWSEEGLTPTRFPWVQPESSLQWAALKRSIRLLRARENELFVVLGPFNEHMLAGESRVGCQQWKATVIDWLESEGLPYAAPPTLPSELYGDASHPLTQGYARLAKELMNDKRFAEFVQ